MNNFIIWIFLAIFIIIISVWWLLNISQKPTRTKKISSKTCFLDMEADFRNRDERFYMSNNFIAINVKLQDSDFRYQIISSNGKLLYDNRSYGIEVKSPINSFEVQQAISSQSSSCILRNKKRYAAFYICDNKGRARVVRLSSLNAKKYNINI